MDLFTSWVGNEASGLLMVSCCSPPPPREHTGSKLSPTANPNSVRGILAFFPFSFKVSMRRVRKENHSNNINSRGRTRVGRKVLGVNGGLKITFWTRAESLGNTGLPKTALSVDISGMVGGQLFSLLSALPQQWQTLVIF